MAEIGIEKKRNALELRPRVTGKILIEADDGVVLQVGGCVVEIPRRHIVEQTPKADQVELTLSGDAEILVSTAVSVQKGFVADNVFGALVRDLQADACNCNCNCSSGNCNCNCNCNERMFAVESPAVMTTRVFRRPFTGGAKR